MFSGNLFINISKGAQQVMNELQSAGFEAYIVGGSLRDCIMSKAPNDFDVATSALPFQTKNILRNHRLIETGLKHGTVTAVAGNENIEITTFRVDGEYSDNRRPDNVKFTTSLEADLCRRDFTINSMAYNEKRGLVDLFGGQDDIKNKIVRCVGDADKRFKEDALRILRALRFSSVLGFDIEEKTQKAIFENADLVRSISYERIYSEFEKLLVGENVEQILCKYYLIVSKFIPEILPMVGFNQNNPYHKYDVFTHTIKTVSSAEKEKILRTTMLLHDIGKPLCYTEKNGIGHFYGHGDVGSKIAEKILKRLKADRKTTKTVCELIRLHDIPMNVDERCIRRLLAQIGEENFELLLKVKFADACAKAKSDDELKKRLVEAKSLAEKIIAQRQCISLKNLEINGTDIINANLAQGKGVGELLEFAFNAVLDEKVENDKEQLMKLVEDIAKGSRRY